jgi:hypothetical protein
MFVRVSDFQCIHHVMIEISSAQKGCEPKMTALLLVMVLVLREEGGWPC